MVDFSKETRLWKKGYRHVVGLDEAGRGPLAGPVVAAAVIVRQFMGSHFRDYLLKDSKKLSARQREHFYALLTNHPQVAWGIGAVSEKTIDKVNILAATKLAMKKAIAASLRHGRNNNPVPKLDDRPILDRGSCFLLIDGNFKISMDMPQCSIVKGDEKVFSITAAGIIAKVTRDRIMEKVHKKYPQYGFSRHKGYGTVFHMEALQAFGPCAIHRKTFWPVKAVNKSFEDIIA